MLCDVEQPSNVVFRIQYNDKSSISDVKLYSIILITLTADLCSLFAICPFRRTRICLKMTDPTVLQLHRSSDPPHPGNITSSHSSSQSRVTDAGVRRLRSADTRRLYGRRSYTKFITFPAVAPRLWNILP